MTPSVTAETTRDGILTISPSGAVNAGNAFLVREAVDTALTGRKPSKITINLAAVTLVDSAGIGVLVSCYHAAAASGVPLVATNPSCAVYRQLWLAGMIGLFGLATPHPHQEPAAA